MTTERSIEEQAPSTVKEVGIHLYYMQQDIRDLKDLLAEQSRTYVTQKEYKSLEVVNTTHFPFCFGKP